MTVLQLIEKLKLCNPNSVVLTDKNGDATIPTDVMGEAIVVAQGVGHQVHSENGGVDYWLSQSVSHTNLGDRFMLGDPAVYIGSGESIVTPLWQKM